MTMTFSRPATEPAQSWWDQRPRARRVLQVVAVALGRLLRCVLAAIAGAGLGVLALGSLVLMSGLVMPMPAKPSPETMTYAVVLAMLVGGTLMAVVCVWLMDAASRRDRRPRRDAARDVVIQAILVRKLGDRAVLGRLRLGVTRGGGLAWSQPMVLGLDGSTMQDRLRARMADRLVVEVAGVFRQSSEVDAVEQTQARVRIDDLLSRIRLVDASRFAVTWIRGHRVVPDTQLLEVATISVRDALLEVPEHVQQQIEDELVLAGTMSRGRFDHLLARGTAATMLGRTPVPDVVPDEWITGGQDDSKGGA